MMMMIVISGKNVFYCEKERKFIKKEIIAYICWALNKSYDETFNNFNFI